MTNTDNVHMLHQPNPRAIRAHLEQLFRRPAKEYPGSRFHIAWSHTDGTGAGAGETYPINTQGFDRAALTAVRRNNEHRNVYVQPNPCNPNTPPMGRADDKDVDVAYYQFADLDKPESLEILRRPLPINYTNSVTTGRTPNPRVHIYWELEEPIRNLSAWREQQRAIADYFQSDPVINPSRLMRLAGTVNYPNPKKATLGYKVEPVTLRTVYDDEKRDPVSSEALYHAYPWSTSRTDFSDDLGHGDPGDETQSAGPQAKPGADRFDTGRRDPMEFVRNIRAGHNLHNNARDLIAHLVNTGHRDWLIRDYLDRLLRPVSDGGTLGQIEELIRSARQKFHTDEPSPESEEDFNAPPPADLYEPLDFDQLAQLPPPSYLIENLITDYGLTVIFGDPASGKTFLALDMALHLAYGASWHERETRQTGILYIVGEGVRGFAKRVKAWRHHKGKHANPAPFLTLPTALDFMAPGDVQKLARTIEHTVKTTPIGLIVVDTVARNMNGDENDAKDMNRFVSACDALREKFAIAVIGIHHCGKDHERGMRGSTALPGASDTIIEVERNQKETVMTVTCRKQKDDDEPKPFYMEMVTVPIEPLSTQTSLVLKMLGPQKPNGNGNGKHTNPTHQQITLIFDEIERAWNANRPWSVMPQTKHEGRYLPTWIASNTEATSQTALKWIEDWLMNGCLQTAIGNTHSKQKGLRVLFRPGTYTGT
jgi:hypothetical protein